MLREGLFSCSRGLRAGYRRAARSRKVATIVLLSAVALLATPFAVGENDCLECHEEQFTQLLAGPHRGVVEETTAFCTTCHGNADRHLESTDAEDIRGPAELRQWTATQQSATCLECHDRTLPQWEMSVHRDEVGCWSCHADQAMHGSGSPAPGSPSSGDRSGWTLCTQCHPGVRAEFRQEYHHPVPEGTVRCTDCHSLHGESRGSALSHTQGGACTSCHQEQSGPFLFEHPVVTEEGCAACHLPHGSWNRDLLISAGQAICTSCHLQSNFPGMGKIPHDFRLNGGARCWDCHSSVHGSNTTPDFNPRGRR